MSETIEAAAEAGTVDDDLRDAVTNTPADVQHDGAEGSENEQPEAEPEEIEEIELSFGAKTLKVPKTAIPDDVRAELEDFTKGVQGDYTRKTQEVAEQRKEAEVKRELFEKLSTLKGEALASFTAGQRLAAEIQQLEQIDLNAVWQSNPDQARQISDAVNSKHNEFQRHVNAVAQHEATMSAEEQRAIATLEAAGRAEMARVVKGFDENVEREMISYAVKNGISEQDAKRWALNPKTAQFAWKAMQFDKLQASTKAATAAKPLATPAAPVRAVSGRSTAPAAKAADQMTDEEYYRWEMSKTVKALRR